MRWFCRAEMCLVLVFIAAAAAGESSRCLPPKQEKPTRSKEKHKAKKQHKHKKDKKVES
jgi:hypothetical protein